MKKESYILRLLLDWILICVGVLGSLFCLTTAYEFEMPTAILVLVPVLAMFFCLLFVGKAGKFYALGVLGLLLLAAWLLREEMIEGLRNLWGTLGCTYAKGYDFFRDLLPREAADPEAIGPGLVTLAVLETYLSSLAVRLWRRTLPAILAILPGIAACFILMDTPPALFPLFAAVASILTQVFSQSARRRKTPEQSRTIVLSALLSAALLGLLLLLIPRESYSPPITWEELSRKLERWGEEQNNRGNAIAGLAGNPKEVDLTDLGSLPNRPVVTLYVTSSKDAFLYLRGSSYASFDGSKWTRGALWQGGEEALFPCLKQPGDATLAIQTREPEALIYTTYELTKLPDSGTVFADAYIENTGAVNNYTMRFTENPGAIAVDRAYETWVRENCLEIPEQTRAAVLAWWEEVDGRKAPGSQTVVTQNGDEVMIGTGDPERTIQFARQAAVLISKTARYNRSPLRMPSGEDFCTWFLNEAEEGYCVHYATTCTALLRALDIPARYASGYISQVEAGERTAVTNLQAHAWVEIWVGGRWIVIEPTPDDATEFSGSVNPNGIDPVVETEPPAIPPATEELTDPPPITKPRPSETINPTAEVPSPTSQPGDEGAGDRSEGKDRTVSRIFWWILGFAALTLGRRELTLWLRERRLIRARGNERARLLYRRIQRLSKLGGGPVPSRATEVGGKAAFSQHTVDDEDLFYLRQIYEQQRNNLRYSNIWKRLWCMFGLAVI